MQGEHIRLDDLYKMTAHIYSEQNAHRPPSATFAHFVEVCGLLTIRAQRKKREGVTFEDALCKALGWFFPLLAKFKVVSVEQLVYRKYPNVCPYCREKTHNDKNCKTVLGTKHTVDHASLKAKYIENRDLRPGNLNAWQEMFARIYPRPTDKPERAVVGLFEELGELSEAVRVFDRYPKYFAGEAADVFSYLMALANDFDLQLRQEDQAPFNFEAEFLRRYPGLCVQCGYPVCTCPLVPDSTVGRMAKELDIAEMKELFAPDFEVYREESMRVADRILAKAGGYEGVATAGVPFDRGKANRDFMLFCLSLAEKTGDPKVAERLRSAALQAGKAATYAGSPRQPERLGEILKPLLEVVKHHRVDLQRLLQAEDAALTDNVGKIVIGEFVLGDKYDAGQVLAQGPHAEASRATLHMTDKSTGDRK